jgi:ribonucleoside-diphosphate reductase alpha chain
MLTIPSQAQATTAGTIQTSETKLSSVAPSERVDYSGRYWDSTQETLVGLYGKRDPISGLPTETINDIIHRVADAVAIAELKYAMTPQELLNLTLEEALAHPRVMQWRKVFADCIGNQKFWANTPANINADPATSVKVLQYWAHGKLAGLKEDEIWLRSEELRLAVISGASDISESKTSDISVSKTGASESKTGPTAGKNRLSEHEAAMGALAQSLRGTGCLAACGVAYVVDSLEGIQDAARIESLAAKAAMGMGLNTSSLRPWSSIIANGAAASGPDRFYEKTIAKAVEAVAQGGRRGGALIELRNSDHPDILFFIEKKKLTPPPSLSKIFKAELGATKRATGEDETTYKKRVLAAAEQKYGQIYAQYIDRQNYLKNTNVTVLAMPGFMQAVETKKFIPASFANKTWTGPIYDPRKTVLDEKGQPKINKLTKELVFEEYSVDLAKFPEALPAARSLSNAVVELSETRVKVKSHFYAPDIFSRIVEGMRDSGEPGIAFYETVNAANANNHVYELNTCNPCGEQFLPAGPGLDGRTYMGNCNLSSMHAAHNDFWNPDGSYNFAAMRSVCRIQQRFMDNVTDVSWYPIPAQNMTARLERRNGGGFAGIAEYLSRQGVRFGEAEASQCVEELFRHYTKASFEASSELAKERGVYPLWEGSRYHKKNQRVRNSCMTNNAPTGTLAQALQTSWGVDPHNGVVFSRKVRSRFVDFVAPGFKELMQKHNAWPSTDDGEQSLMKQIRANNKSVQGLISVPQAVQKAYPIRVEVDPEQYIRHLAAIHNGASEYPETFNSVSNTCSIALDSDEQAVADSAILAWKLGVKDITFYPDGSRLSQPVEKIASQDYQRETDLLSQLGHQERRSINAEETTGQTYKVRVGSPEGVSTLHVSLNHENDRPGELIEIYARMGKPGAVEAGLFEAVGRLASAFLQYAAEFGESERMKAEETIVHQLVNIQSGYPAFFKFGDSDKPVVIQSPCDGLAKSIQHYRLHSALKSRNDRDSSLSAAQNGGQMDFAAPLTPPHEPSAEQRETPLLVNAPSPKRLLPTCGKCGSDASIKIDGCLVCQGCGFSKCG